MKVAEIAKATGYSVAAIRAFAAKKKIPGWRRTKKGGHYRFDDGLELQKWIRSNSKPLHTAPRAYLSILPELIESLKACQMVMDPRPGWFQKADKQTRAQNIRAQLQMDFRELLNLLREMGVSDDQESGI
jgi:DNA-binding transcriptional MerR regulator